MFAIQVKCPVCSTSAENVILLFSVISPSGLEIRTPGTGLPSSMVHVTFITSPMRATIGPSIVIFGGTKLKKYIAMTCLQANCAVLTTTTIHNLGHGKHD